MPHAGRDRVPLSQERRAPVRSLFAALLAASEGLDNRAGDQPLVDCRCEGVEKRCVEAVLADHDVVRANGGAALLMISAPVEPYAAPGVARAVGARQGDEGA